MPKKFEINPNTESVEITLARKKSERDIFTPPVKKGILQNRRRDEYFPRRAKATTGWRFLDLGQYYFEDYIEDVNFTADANNTFSSATGITTDDLQTADVTAKANYYTGEIAVWKTEGDALSNPTPEKTAKHIRAKILAKYFQLKKLSSDVFLITITTKFGSNIPLDSNSARWQGDKIKIADNESVDYVIIRGNPLFYQTYIDCRPSYRQYGAKVTKLPSFSADEDLTFTLTRNADFYLAPAFCGITFTATGKVNSPHDRNDVFTQPNPSGEGEPVTGNTPYNFTQDIYFDYHSFPRNYFIEYLILWRSFNFALTASGLGNSSYTVSSYRLFYYVSQELLVLYPEFINYSFLVDNAAFPVTEIRELNHWNFPNPNLFPLPDNLPQINAYGEAGDYRAFWNAYTKSGDLLAIIYQNNELFYVWKR